MRYSLLSRFQGTLLGAALGELWGANSNARLQIEQSDQGVDRVGNKLKPAIAPITNSLTGQGLVESFQPIGGWGSVAIDCANLLIHQKDSADLWLSLDSSAGMAIATLPIALFFHEDSEKLQLYLSRTLRSASPEVRGGVLAVGQAIALALREQLNPAELIPQLLAELNLVAYSPLLSQKLEQVQICLDQRLGLSAVTSRLIKAPSAIASDVSEATVELAAVALAFYCFLSTPEDYKLSLLRAAHGSRLARQGKQIGKSRLASPGSQVAIATAVTGALSGAYNSRAGIPVDWHTQTNSSDSYHPLAALWGLASTDKIDAVAGKLMAVWAGVEWTSCLPNQSNYLPIAAPHVIRYH